MDGRKVAQMLRRTPRVLGLVWLVVHFALTFLFCFPNNPIKMREETVLNAVIGRYFSQNWALFAPTPIQSNQTLLVRCLTSSEAMAVRKEPSSTEEHWDDITMPLFRRHQQNRFTAYDRLSRTHTNFLKAYLQGGGSLQALSKACRDHDREACEIGNGRLKEIRASAIVPLVKVASSYCREPGQPLNVSHVALRARETAVRPWSQRDDDSKSEARSVDIDIGTYPIDREAPTTGVLKGKT